MTPNNPPPLPVDLESDPRFPSGKWFGFWTQTVPIKMKPTQEMVLTFRAGQMEGEGRDMVGAFHMRGQYSVDDGRCRWTKRYVGKHDVVYQGFNEGKGIWGNWTIDSSRGGFHIWPEGMTDPSEPELHEEADVPVDITEPVMV